MIGSNTSRSGICSWSRPFLLALAVFQALLCFQGVALAADWPAWRYDAGRTSCSPAGLPRDLHLQWTRQYPRLRPAWPDAKRLRFDLGYQPVVCAGMVIVGSSREDSVVALDLATGAERWRFLTGGPVRFAPFCWRKRVYAGSDDGYLYCLDVASGRLLWKYAGAPDAGRKVIGNSRLISTWPVRGGPVIVDGTVYFAAGVWPFMGVFVHAVDALSGKRVWTNSGTGSLFMDQPHNSPAFAGLAPQGYLAVNGDRLLVPNGRSVAACLRRSDGRLLYYHHARNSRNGRFFLATRGKLFYNSQRRFRVSNGSPIGWMSARPVLGLRRLYCSVPLHRPREGETRPKAEPAWVWHSAEGNPEALLRGDGVPRIRIMAGKRLYATGNGEVMALEMPTGDREAMKVSWRAPLEGRPWSMLAAGGRLLVVTLEGKIFCYGGKKVVPREHPHVTEPLESHGPGTDLSEALLKALPGRQGFCVILGEHAAGAAACLADRGTKMDIVALLSDPARVRDARRMLARCGLHGHGAMILADGPELRLPPWFARTVVFTGREVLGTSEAERKVSEAYRLLRPYGGTACFPAGEHQTLVRLAGKLKLPGAEVRKAGSFALLVRKGALQGAGQWTHQYGNPANTVISEDRLVKAPLGLLWFGGPSNTKVLPRHGHGPNPQAAGGRVVVEGPDMLRALDVYTGRLLWEAELPGLGRPYDSTLHQPGANALGSNYVTLGDAVYVVYRGRCLKLDGATGKQVASFALPPEAPKRGPAAWGYIGVFGETLLAGASPQELYDPGFSPEGLKKRVRKPEAITTIIGWLGKLKNFRIEKRGGEEPPASIAARNLNRLLGEKCLEERIPGKLAGNAEAIARRIRLYVRSKPDIAPTDVRLREMNRVLMNACCFAIPPKERRGPGKRMSWNAVSSRRLVAMNRHSGKVLWQVRARQTFMHNAICAGGGKVFCVDRYPTYMLKELTFLRGGRGTPRLLALDARTGKELWSFDKEVFAPFLSYSREGDLLVQSSRASRDHLPETDCKLVVHNAGDGSVVWRREMVYKGPVLINGDMLILKGKALDLKTGKIRRRIRPLTGGRSRWEWRKHYGCDTAVGSRHLLTFRSASAGYLDLARDGGTGNIGGIKSGCTSNLIVADGVLAAPEYTRTCTCSYQNQSSLGLIHDPRAEMWTFNSYEWSGRPVLRAGINFGAPGDRKAGNGTLWTDWPSVGDKSPDLPVTVAPLRKVPAGVIPVLTYGDEWGEDEDEEPGGPRLEPATFLMHSSEVRSGKLPWVAASGLRDVRRLTVDLGAGKVRKYRLRLFFCEPDEIAPGRRRFDVVVQGRKALEGLDVCAQAGGPRRGLVKEVAGVAVTRKLVLEFKPRSEKLGAVISGIEIILEN